jgi:sensor domain DACNV-containing protein
MTSEPHDVTKAPDGVDDPAPGDPPYAYPPALTDLILTRWRDVQRATGTDVPTPARDRLEAVLSSCYQASLLREEGRAVTFRVALAGRDAFSTAAGPPTGLHRLAFQTERRLDPHELRRLSPAAAFSRSFIGASLEGADGPQVWGLVHSGPQWLQSVRGGRETQQAIPPVLTVAVTGPGRLLVSAGIETIAELSQGTLVADRLDVFEASWMHELFRTFGEDMRRALSVAGSPAGDTSAMVDPAFAPSLAQHVLRRVLATIRGTQHGGTLLIMPGKRARALLNSDGVLRVKYGFHDEEPRRRLLTLTLRIMQELERVHGRRQSAPVGWREYETSDATTIVELDQALFEVAHLVADLSQVDGAVVMTTDLELVGFGAEITSLPDIGRVARATDLEGIRRDWVKTDRVGTRHRSVYRLCHEVRDVIGLVVSQDGGLRFVRWCRDAVTYWDQFATGPWEV